MQNVVVSVPEWFSAFTCKLPPVPLDFNVTFLQSVPGAFKIAHTLLGMICLSVIANYSQFFHPVSGTSLGILCSKSVAYFLLVSYGFFATSLILLVSSTVSYFTASFLPKTAFEFLYHLVACIMYLSSSLTLMCTLIIDSQETHGYKEPGFEAKVAASVLGLLNSVLYGISTLFSFKAQKQLG